MIAREVDLTNAISALTQRETQNIRIYFFLSTGTCQNNYFIVINCNKSYFSNVLSTGCQTACCVYVVRSVH